MPVDRAWSSQITPVSTALIPTVRGMPSQLFAPDIVVLLKQKMAAADAVGFSYFKNSACHKYNVRHSTRT